jgi:hypothetical protein
MSALVIITDSTVDPREIAEFLATLNDVYSDLSGGDELVIVGHEMASRSEDNAEPLPRVDG